MAVTSSEDSQILVVDDDEGLAALFEAVLEDAGYPVITAHSGREAVERVGERMPSLILLDIRMPGMDGIQTFRELRRRVPQSRVIFMTGYAEPPLERARTRGGSIERMPERDDIEQVVDLVIEIAEDRGALVLAQDPARSRELVQTLPRRGFEPQVVKSAHEAIFFFEGTPRQVVLLEEELDRLPPLIIRDLTPGAVRLLLSHAAASRPGPDLPAPLFLAKPFRPDELLHTVELAVAPT